MKPFILWFDLVDIRLGFLEKSGLNRTENWKQKPNNTESCFGLVDQWSQGWATNKYTGDI